MESNVFKPAVFTPSSLVLEQHLRASRALNPLPTRTDAVESRLPIDCATPLALPTHPSRSTPSWTPTHPEQIRVWNPVLARSREDVTLPGWPTAARTRDWRRRQCYNRLPRSAAQAEPVRHGDDVGTLTHYEVATQANLIAVSDDDQAGSLTTAC